VITLLVNYTKKRVQKYVVVLMENLYFDLVKRLKQNKHVFFCFEAFDFFMAYLSQKLCLYLMFKLLKRAYI